MISTKRVADHDPSLDALLDLDLDLDGQRFTIEPSGHSVKFAVRRVPETSERPQEINYFPYPACTRRETAGRI
jgi:hypothetical protein